MSVPHGIGIAVLCALAPILTAPAPAQSSPTLHDIPNIVRESAPAVGTVIVRDLPGREIAVGSGFVVSNDGKVITNLHVVATDGAAQAEIRFQDGATYRIQGVLASDSDRDLAVLKIRAVGKEFPFLRLGDSDRVQVGERVVAIGSPLAEATTVSTENTVSEGIVSGIRDWPSGKIKIIQITAPISPGSSGGALLNLYSEAIGVTFAQLTAGQNLNFAIPASYVKQLVASSTGEMRALPLPRPARENDGTATTREPVLSSPDVMLRSAKTLYIWTYGSPVLKSELSDKLLQWGKLTLVSSEQQADLILEVKQTGELNVGTGAGNQATASLKDRASGVQLWSKTKGGSWAMSGWSNAWVARALAKEFTKFFDQATKGEKNKDRGK